MRIDPSVEANILAEFTRMRILHPRVDEAIRTFEVLRELGVREPFAQKKYCTLFAPTFSGKSMAVTMYIEGPIADQLIQEGLFPAEMPREEIRLKQRRVLHVTLSSPATSVRALASDMIQALGVSVPRNKNTVELLYMAFGLMRSLGVQLLVIDEMHHLSATSRQRADGRIERVSPFISVSIPNTIKTLLNKGVAPVALIGTEDANRHVSNNSEFRSRLYKELDFSPIKLNGPEMLDVFANFAGQLAYEIVERKLVQELPDFCSKKIPACLAIASEGRIGELSSNLVCQACVRAVSAGARSITVEHLSATVDAWSIPRGYCKSNPFRDFGLVN